MTRIADGRREPSGQQPQPAKVGIFQRRGITLKAVHQHDRTGPACPKHFHGLSGFNPGCTADREDHRASQPGNVAQQGVIRGVRRVEFEAVGPQTLRSQASRRRTRRQRPPGSACGRIRPNGPSRSPPSPASDTWGNWSGSARPVPPPGKSGTSTASAPAAAACRTMASAASGFPSWALAISARMKTRPAGLLEVISSAGIMGSPLTSITGDNLADGANNVFNVVCRHTRKHRQRQQPLISGLGHGAVAGLVPKRLR